ncbi:Putative AMP-dependent synthetase/ligase, fatty acyl-coenzyme A reductase, NAD-binding protein [Septoria linicola]|uniref:AMP-dependent synthetase/ligase, fatty acyl-coenzyme A reductase, NAD-binding protein n=1 Tax=Septoria linicola TaxID=215465 RepID=A0A9Q9B5N9_9PEZI|nr:Putative AMP-dependent synthetase/ligase, fatty acyl-coenzyme A reductase, NAD-binding protein [Septoria linicola]
MAQAKELTNLPLPAYIDHLATLEPDQPFAEVIAANDGTSRKITIKQLSVAINKAAWWLDERLRHLYLSRTFAFVSAGSDLRYWILMLAGCKTGRLAFFPSPKNDTDAQCYLFQKYACKILLLPNGSSVRSDLQGVIESESLACLEVPELDYFLSFAPDPYVWHWGPKTIATEPLVGLHSSGSTGLPKPVKVKHGNALAMEKWKLIPDLGHGKIHFCHWTGKRVLLTLPLFHLAAINLVMAAIQNRFLLVFPPAGPVPINAQMVSDIINKTKIDVSATSPSILADMAADRKLLGTLSKVGCAAFGGGPLPEEAGEAIRRRTQILSIMGMSETGILPCEIPDDRDWQYTHLSPVLGAELRPAADNLFSLFFVRNEACKDYQVAFFTYPERTEYGTGDLFSKHPTRPGLWKWEGRNDDIIVYSTGEKYNPTLMENLINGHPAISAALVCGTGHPNSALLVEPAHPEVDPDDFVEEIYPHVRKVNANVPAYARIVKDMILVTEPRKPLARAGKGTVQRQASTALYEKELNELYESPRAGRKDSKASAFSVISLPREASLSPTRAAHSIESISSPSSGAEVVITSRALVRQQNGSPSTAKTRRRWGEYDTLSLARQILDILKYNFGLTIAADQDIFAAGVDSLGVTTIVRELQRLLSPGDQADQFIAPKVVYQNPTAIGLAAFLCGDAAEEICAEEQMQKLFEKYTVNLPITARVPLVPNQSAKIVVLTGSTGSFGTYILDSLLRDDTVAEIICLNRRVNAAEVQARSLIRKGMSANFTKKSVTFTVCDLSRPYLGLDIADYKDFLGRATHIIHNAWNVNFNLPLSYFDTPHIQGVRQLIDFSARSKYGAMIFFISSIGAVSDFRQPLAADGKARPIPEVAIEDWTAASQEGGYGQSKLVAERILAAAAKNAGIPSAICRFGQIAGPSPGDGDWQRNEWLPTLVVSSRNMGCLPTSLGSFNNVDWVPIDLAAKVVLEFVHHATKKLQTSTSLASQTVVYHAVNPRPTPWQSLLPAVQASLAVQKTVPFQEWIDILARLGDQDINQYPAVKLVSFYRSLIAADDVRLNTLESQRASWTLKELKPVTGDMLRGWIRRWF